MVTSASRIDLVSLSKEVRRSTDFLDVLINGVGDGIFMVDLEGRFLFVNQLIAQSSGFLAEAFVGRHFLELIRSEDHERVRSNFARTLAGEDVPPYELAYRTSAGELMWVEINSARVVVDSKLVCVLAISRNVQERKAMEANLRESEEKHRNLLDNLPHAVTIVQNEEIVFANEAAKHMFGVQLGQNIVVASQPDVSSHRIQHADYLRRRLAGDPTVPCRYRSILRAASGHEYPVEVFAQHIEYASHPAVQYMAIDLTEQQQLEEQVRQAQKMDALGTLAGGIAHDFNNLLTGILSMADLLDRTDLSAPDRHKAARLVRQAAERAAGLTQQLLGFARKSKPAMRVLDVHLLINEVCELLSHTIDKRIRLVKYLQAERSVTLGDPSQLQQVIMNLAVNGRDAMPDGGELCVETHSVDVEPGHPAEAFGLMPGPYVEIRVRDSGRGIPQEVRGHIFEPFFTTKPQGQGSGMGLAVVYGILQAHNGAIRLNDTTQGTSFSVYLPGAAPEASSPEEVRQRVVPGAGVVLVVDDEPILRESARLLLDAMGYEVLTCAGGAEALETYRSHGRRIDLVIIDVSMPQMSGWECLDRLRQLDPSIKAVMTSGYGFESTIEDPTVPFLAKPYTMDELSKILAEQLLPAR